MQSLFIEVIDGSHEPIGTSRLTIVGRPSLVARWESPAGVVYGEATPLAGYGRDDFELARQNLDAISAERLSDCLREVCQRYRASGSGSASNVPVEAIGDSFPRLDSPAARFCVEMLVLSAAARLLGVPLWRLLVETSVASRLPTSAVVDPLSVGWRRAWRGAVEQNIEHFKVKCGRDDAVEAAVIEEMCQGAPDTRLRLDANGAWTIEAALRFVDRLSKQRIDWVEDPTGDPSQWALLGQRSGVRCAIDEPLTQADPELGLEAPLPDVVVLKPMALGGFSTCMRWAVRARQRGSLVVVSHLFDGPIAMTACIHLAFAIQSPSVAPGLGRHAALSGHPRRLPAPANLSDSWLTCPAVDC